MIPKSTAIYQRRTNRGTQRLLACTPCAECKSTIYPDAVTAYRVREVSTGFMAAPAFYYAHALGQCEPEVN